MKAIRRVEALLAALPQDLSENLIFECRLGAATGRLDVALRLDLRQPAEARVLATAGPPSDGPLGSPGWEPVRRLAGRWLAADASLASMDTLWLELDLPTRGPAPTAPGVFFGVTGTGPPNDGPGTAADEDSRFLAHSLASTIGLLRPGIRPERLGERLTDVLTVLPAGARLFQTGVMLGRDDPRIRLCIEGLAPGSVPDLLTALGAPAAHLPETETALDLASYADDLALALDVGDDLGPTVGLELYSMSGSEASLDRLLERLESAGLCGADQRSRLLAYRGRSFEPGSERAEGGQVLMAHDLSHVKLVVTPGQPLAAKAYLAVKRRRVPEQLLQPPWAPVREERSPGRTPA